MPNRTEQHGLFVLYPLSQDENVDMDIVFIHGLGGDAYNTWTANNGKMWPRDLLPHVIPTARVMTFGYDSKWAFSPSTADIKDFALDLLNRLRAKRWSPRAMQNPVVFICHSLGGIVCKKALILANSNQYYTNIFEKTSAILFFGTPHRGSRVAGWGTMMANFINTCTFHHPFRKALLKDLDKGSKTLAEISTSFKFFASDFDIKTFYETAIMAPLKGPVVERDSAELGFSNEQCIPIAANHRELVHFTGVNEKFDPVRSALTDVRKGSRVDADTLKTAFLYLAGSVDTLGNYHGGVLSVADYDQQLSNICIRAPGTCEWLIGHPSFSTWLKSTFSECIWLRGYAGVGKSVIAKYLITSVIGSNYIRSKRNAASNQIAASRYEHFLIYFLFSETQHDSRTERNVLRSILHQLLLGAPMEVVQKLEKFKSADTGSGGYTFLDSISALWDAVKAALVIVSWKVTYLVFDALDEMLPGNVDTFASGIRDLMDTVSHQIKPRTIKILITSRPNPSIEKAVSPPSISVKSERDVRHFIENRAKDLSQRFGLSNEVRDRIVTQLCEKAGSMFLWACLAWDELCLGATRQSQFLANLKKAQNLPSKLESLYENILDRLNPADLKLTLNAFAWLIAATRPLHSSELRFAIALEAEQVKATKLASYDMICRAMISENTIRKLCPNLIHANEKGYMQFVHSSVKDFLTHSNTPARFQFEQMRVHEKIAVLSLRSLCLSGFDARVVQTDLCSQMVRTETEMIDIPARYHLLQYASVNWPIHAKSCKRSKEVWWAFKDFLQHPRHVKLWLMLSLYDDSLLAQGEWSESKDFWLKDDSLPPHIHVAVFLNDPYLVEKLVEDGHDINELNSDWYNTDPKYRRPNLPPGGGVLHFQDLDIEMVECLVRLGADASKPDTSRISAIKRAIHNQNEALVVKLIQAVQQRKTQKSKTPFGPDALRQAATANMLSVVSLLLDDLSTDLSSDGFLGEDSSVLGTYITTPLDHACLYGMESVASVMMSHPRMRAAQAIKEEKRKGRNPTGLALITTLQGWSDLTLTALQNFPTDLAAERDQNRRIILHHAAMEGWHDVLEACLARLPKSKLSIQDKNGMTALHLAAKERNWYATGRLLEAGADKQMEDDEGRTASHVAAEAGSDRVLRMMLDKGALMTNSLDSKKRTVLHYIATWNMAEIAGRLLEMDENCVQTKDRDGRTAAHMAALFGSTATLSMLLATKAVDINAADYFGKTLLHCAVEGSVESCIDELLSREEISLNPLDRHLKSPLDITASFKDQAQAETIRIQLKAAGCAPGLWRQKSLYRQQQVKDQKPPSKDKDLPLAIITRSDIDSSDS